MASSSAERQENGSFNLYHVQRREKQGENDVCLFLQKFYKSLKANLAMATRVTRDDIKNLICEICKMHILRAY